MAAINYVLLLFLFPFINGSEETSTQDTSEPKTPKLYSIEGSAEVSDNKDPKAWLMDAKVLVDGGRYIGHLKASGDFKIHNIPPGSYLVELAHPNYIFDGVRVDISSKSGKIRARRQNPMKPGSVNSLPYPVRFVTQKQAKFFEKREAWNIMDIAKNPMILFLVAPLLLMLVLPRLLNMADPNTQKEMQESMQMFQNPSSSMPSMEEMFTNFFGGGGGGSKKKTAQTSSGSSNKKNK